MSAIRVDHLSKQYRIGGPRVPYQTLRESLAGVFNHSKSAPPATVWALQDVSFDVAPGEVLGIIGRNGAGKSTLLKLLSRITKPTSGRAIVRGRVGSLLEVGTGFHPELTGRENIYLSGTILGMKRSEIDRQFDEIAAFAEIEKFLNTPVKRYSSGMYVRLAFAVAAHLEPEILLVDEVLAVGDAAFQQKCLGKMGEVARTGRTILFVSHNMGAIANLCSRAAWLDRGQLMATGDPSDMISQYLNQTIDPSAEAVISLAAAQDSDASFTEVAIVGEDQRARRTVEGSSRFYVRLVYSVKREIKGLEVSFSLFDNRGSKIFYSGLAGSQGRAGLDHLPGKYVGLAELPANFLAPGLYFLTIGLHQPNICLFDRREQVIGFSVLETGSPEYRYVGSDIGSVLVHLDWQHGTAEA